MAETRFSRRADDEKARDPLPGPEVAKPRTLEALRALANDINGCETLERYAIRRVVAAWEAGIALDDRCVRVAETALARRRARFPDLGLDETRRACRGAPAETRRIPERKI